MENKEKIRLKQTLKHLQEINGSGTELISVYIPSGQPIHLMANRLKNELSQTDNIKSKATKHAVSEALERILHQLRLYNNAPPSGLVVFCGKGEVIAIIPPEDLKIQLYRCGSQFYVEPLQNMLEAKKVYGLVLLDGRECSIAILKGTSFNIVKTLNCLAHSKCGKGGQSKRRFERIREESIEYYYKRIGEYMNKIFIGKTKEIIVGGPGPCKEDFLKLSPFHYEFKVLGVRNTGYTDEPGVRELMAQSDDIIGEQEAIIEKKVLDEFLCEIRNNGLVEYGFDNVRKCIDSGNIRKLLISEPKMSEYTALIEKAENNGTELCIVSTDTQEGQQFLLSFHGLGVFTKYASKNC